MPGLPKKPDPEKDPEGFREYKRLQKAAYRARKKAEAAEEGEGAAASAAAPKPAARAAPKPAAPSAAVEILKALRAAKAAEEAAGAAAAPVVSEGGAVSAPVLAAKPQASPLPSENAVVESEGGAVQMTAKPVSAPPPPPEGDRYEFEGFELGGVSYNRNYLGDVLDDGGTRYVGRWDEKAGKIDTSVPEPAYIREALGESEEVGENLWAPEEVPVPYGLAELERLKAIDPATASKADRRERFDAKERLQRHASHLSDYVVPNQTHTLLELNKAGRGGMPRTQAELDKRIASLNRFFNEELPLGDVRSHLPKQALTLAGFEALNKAWLSNNPLKSWRVANSFQSSLMPLYDKFIELTAPLGVKRRSF